MSSEHAASGLLQSPKATRWLLLIITWVAFLVRTANLATQSLWRDEVDAIRFSSWPLRTLLTDLFTAGHNGPFFFVLLRPWRDLLGDSEVAVRYPSALLGTLAIPLGFVLARQLSFNRTTGLLLSLFLATSPYLVWYGQEAKMYALLLVLITVAFTAYLKAMTGAPLPPPLRRQPQTWGWWVIFVVATTISYYTHILSPLMLAVYGVVALLYWPHFRRHWRGWSISMAVLTLPYIPLAIWQVPLLLNGFQSGHPFYSLQQEFYLLLQLYSSGLIRFAPADLLSRLIITADNSSRLLQESIRYLQHPLVGLTPLMLYVFLFLGGLFLGSKGRLVSETTHRLILVVWALLPPFIIYLISLRVPVFEERYLIYIIPAFYLLAALGLGQVWQHSRWLASTCFTLLLLINLFGLWQQQRRPIKADIRAAAAYLSTQPQPPEVIMVQIPYLQHTLDYYYEADYILLEGLWTNDDKSETTVAAEMTTLTADLTDLWLVVSEEALWDRRYLTRTWLDKHADLVDEAHFMRVDVYHYQLRPGAIERQSVGTAE